MPPRAYTITEYSCPTGRSHEKAGAPAFWPWVQVWRSAAQTVGVERLERDLGASTDELVRMLPEMRQLSGFQEPPPINNPEAAQFRLFDAYTSTTRQFTVHAPVLLVLDDLHWADKPTLLLLQHLARELASLRVLVVGTYRDTELARTHPLSEALAELNRIGMQRVNLRGLTLEEVGDYIRAAANVEPARELLDRIYEETEGNPFFLSEVVNFMTEEDTLSADSVSDIAIPEGVREALGRRLDRISDEPNELLTVAAVAGREFTYETLQLLGERDDEALLRLIEEGLEARVTEETEEAGRYRFTLALMLETLLSELSTTRRVRLHGQIGEALEARYGERAEEHASRLAQHFVESATLTLAHAQKAARYSRLAGEQAEAMAAWAEGARHYEQCLGFVSESEDGLGQDEAALLHALARNLFHAGDLRRAHSYFEEAFERYRERGEGVDAASVAVAAMARPGLWLREQGIAFAERALETLAGADPRLEALLLLARAASDTDPASWEAAARAAELAERHDLEDVGALLDERGGRLAFEELRLEEAVALAQRAFESHISRGDDWRAARAAIARVVYAS